MFEECYTRPWMINSHSCALIRFTQMPDPAIIKLYQAWDLMQKGADKLGASSSYQFDLFTSVVKL